MENNMETLGSSKTVYNEFIGFGNNTLKMENHMKTTMEHNLQTGVLWGLARSMIFKNTGSSGSL